jgi:hypothetical protein
MKPERVARHYCRQWRRLQAQGFASHVGPTQLLTLPLELLDPRLVLGGHARSRAAIKVRLHTHFRSDSVAPQLASYPGDGAVALTAASACFLEHPDRSFTKLGRVATTMSTVRCW